MVPYGSPPLEPSLVVFAPVFRVTTGCTDRHRDDFVQTIALDWSAMRGSQAEKIGSRGIAVPSEDAGTGDICVSSCGDDFT